MTNFDDGPWPPSEMLRHLGERISEYLNSGGLLSLPTGEGPIGELESLFEQLTGCTYALAFNSGTNAIHSAYCALGLTPGDRVVVSPYSFHSTVTPLLQLGLLPVFVDIDDDGNMDPESLTSELDAKAVMVTHMYGVPADMPSICAKATRLGMSVIEDCSHAHGATILGQPVGSWGDIGIFSLQANKLVPAGEGGIMVTSTREFYELGLLMGHFGPRCEKEVSTADLRSYAVTGFGFKHRMHPLAALAGLEAFGAFRSVQPIRASAARLVAEHLSCTELLNFNNVEGRAYYLNRVVLKPAGLLPNEFVSKCQRAGIPVRLSSLRPLSEEALFAPDSSSRGNVTWLADISAVLDHSRRCLSIPTPSTWRGVESLDGILAKMLDLALT